MNTPGNPLTMLSLLRRDPFEVNCESIALMNGISAASFASGKGNPWLAGMPNGSQSTNLVWWDSGMDYAGSTANSNSSPGMISLSSASVTPGSTVQFDQVSGGANNGGDGSSVFSPDGNLGWMVHLGGWSGRHDWNFGVPLNGIRNVRAPINAMMAVFLNDSVPSSSSAPQALDFQDASARDYVSLSPQLKQVFFVGDGRRSNGEVQQVVVPAGATRLFVGNMDAWEWNNNVGGYNVQINSTTKVATVK